VDSNTSHKACIEVDVTDYVKSLGFMITYEYILERYVSTY